MHYGICTNGLSVLIKGIRVFKSHTYVTYYTSNAKWNKVHCPLFRLNLKPEYQNVCMPSLYAILHLKNCPKSGGGGARMV